MVTLYDALLVIGAVLFSNVLYDPPSSSFEQRSRLLCDSQVQELLLGLQSRVDRVEKTADGGAGELVKLREKLQHVELENAAMRAEQRALAPSDKLMQVERDVAQKLHAHLEHVSSVESEHMSEALKKMHRLQVGREEEEDGWMRRRMDAQEDG